MALMIKNKKLPQVGISGVLLSQKSKEKTL
jgi:hypothetical protein